MKLRVASSIFYSEPATGKTSTTKRLTGEIENLGQQPLLPSTGIEKPCTINLDHETDKCSVLLTKSLKEWKEQDVAAQCQTLLEHIMLASKRDHKSTTSSSKVAGIRSFSTCHND